MTPGLLVVSCAIAASAFTLFALFLLLDRQRSPIGNRLCVAAGASAVWFVWQALYYAEALTWLGLAGSATLEIVRDSAWVLLTLQLLASGRENDPGRQRFLQRARVILGIVILFALVTVVQPALAQRVLSVEASAKAGFAALLMLSVLGLALVEQFYRNTLHPRRWAIKYLCLGVGAMHAYDCMLYADGVLFNRLDSALWTGRGLANALVIPLIAIGVARNREWRLNLFLSRQMVFHGATLLSVGLYLLTVAAAGYYLRAYGGEWGDALRAVLFFTAALFLVSVLGSAEVRSRLRLFLSRNFYRDKYDYGEIWLRFTNLLSQSDTGPAELPQSILKAIADIMDATGGAVWQCNPNGSFGVVATHELDPQRLRAIPDDDPLVAALKSPGRVIDIAAEAERSTLDEPMVVPAWLLEQPRAWLLVPIVHRDQLLAIVLLCESRAGEALVPEDRELLGTLGRQSASYLALMQATAELGDARQFEAFNRLSAFLVHDLKNVIAQLSMVIKNSVRHRGNPEFIDDAFNTIGDAVAKMNRMLGNLRHTQSGPSELLQVADCLREAQAHLSTRDPKPILINEATGDVRVRGSHDRFLAMIEHLAQNAQEATGPAGRVELRLLCRGDLLVLEITDDGCGMTAEFIQHRLFKPFDTTKGKAGMGIGVYESLHIANSMGGRLTVDSRPGKGSTFRIQLPLVPLGEAEGEAPAWEKTA